MKKTILIIMILFNTAFAQEIIFNSGEKKVNLIELYTSQGCSSCPVAEEWINGLSKKEGLFKNFIPLAFHVTYWDFIGWKDVFGNKQNDIRQRAYANNVWHKKSVYTPQFVVNSKEYRRWFSNQSFPRFDEAYAGKLNLSINKGNLDIHFDSKILKDKQLYVNVALLGFDYKTSITAGENEDKHLEGDFIVLKHQQNAISIKNGQLSFNTTVPEYTKDTNKKAIVVWLNDKEGTIIQAVGGYI